MKSYVEQRIKYEDLLIDVFENGIENGNIFEILSNEGSHTNKHILEDGKDPRDRAEKEFKRASYFYSENIQKECIEKILSLKLVDIADWVFGSVDKKLPIRLDFKKPIGYAIDLNLNKYEISKVLLVLTRDDTKNVRFAITTFYPELKNGQMPNETLKRRYPAPRLLHFFDELTEDKNRTFYHASMSTRGDAIKYEDESSHQLFQIYLSKKTKHPKFYQITKEGGKEYSEQLTEAEFERAQNQIYRLIKKYEKDWLNVPVPEPDKKEIKQTQSSKIKRKDIVESYCESQGLDYTNFTKLNGNMYNFATTLVRENINPIFIMDKNFTEDIMKCIKEQLKYNQRAGYGNYSIKVDINNYFKEGCIYSPEQLKELFNIASKGIDTYYMETPDFSPSQMHIIGKALQYNKNNPAFPINIERIARLNFTEKLMEKNLSDEIKESKNKQHSQNNRNNNYRNNRTNR